MTMQLFCLLYVLHETFSKIADMFTDCSQNVYIVYEVMVIIDFLIQYDPLLQMLHVKFSYKWCTCFREDAQNNKLLTNKANDRQNRETKFRLSDPVSLKVWGWIKSQNTAENIKIYYQNYCCGKLFNKCIVSFETFRAF